jgi:hypothetical protein
MHFAKVHKLLFQKVLYSTTVEAMTEHYFSFIGFHFLCLWTLSTLSRLGFRARQEHTMQGLSKRQCCGRGRRGKKRWRELELELGQEGEAAPQCMWCHTDLGLPFCRLRSQREEKCLPWRPRRRIWFPSEQCRCRKELESWKSTCKAGRWQSISHSWGGSHMLTT